MKANLFTYTLAAMVHLKVLRENAVVDCKTSNNNTGACPLSHWHLGHQSKITFRMYVARPDAAPSP